MNDKPSKKLVLGPTCPLKKDIKYEMIGFDIETEGSDNNFVLACLNGNGIKEHFTCKDRLFKFMNSNIKLRDKIFVATNLQFDFLGSFGGKEDYFRIHESGNRIYMIEFYQYKDKSKKIKFIDTLNYFPASVENLGIFLGLPKIKHPKCFGKKPKNYDEYQELLLYCYNDAYISFKFMEYVYGVLKRQGVRLKNTIGSCAMDLFRRHYLKQKFYIEQPSMHKIQLKAYYGGRTENFKRGTFNNVYCYDINSLYPAAMLKEYPNPNTSRHTKLTNINLINRYEGVSYVEGIMPNQYISPLPVKHNDRLVFPVGYIKGYYTHIELRNALNFGFKIQNFGESVFYLETIKIFDNYVNDLYKQRQNLKFKQDPSELMIKLQLNSLYGKFAFRYYLKNEILHLEHLLPEMLDEYEEFEIFEQKNLILLKSKEDWSTPTYYSIPIWSIYCTAYARLIMFDVLKNKDLQKHLIYTDTDSVFLTKKIPESNKIGKFKLEYYVKNAIFVKPKFYLTTKPKIKGVKGLDTKSFLSIINRQPIKQQKFTKFRSVLRSKKHHKYGTLNYNRIINNYKHMNLEDTKRVWPSKFDHNVTQDSQPIIIRK